MMEKRKSVVTNDNIPSHIYRFFYTNGRSMTVAFAVVAIVSFPFFFIPSVILSVVTLLAGLLTFLTEAIEAGMRGLREAQRIDALREDRTYELDAQTLRNRGWSEADIEAVIITKRRINGDD